jgi:hypothetical protein
MENGSRGNFLKPFTGAHRTNVSLLLVRFEMKKQTEVTSLQTD